MNSLFKDSLGTKDKQVSLFRIIEYRGTKEWVEAQVKLSIRGQQLITVPGVGKGVVKAATLGFIPKELTEAWKNTILNKIQTLVKDIE